MPGRKTDVKDASWLCQLLEVGLLAASFVPTGPPGIRRLRTVTRYRKNKAAVAVGHKILIAAWHLMATPDEGYRDLGGDYVSRLDDPDRRKQRLVSQLAALGYQVELTPAA